MSEPVEAAPLACFCEENVHVFAPEQASCVCGCATLREPAKARQVERG